MTEKIEKKARKPKAPAVHVEPAVRWTKKANMALRLGFRFAKSVQRLLNTRGYTPTDAQWDLLNDKINEVATQISHAMRRAEPEQEQKDVF